MRNCVRCLRGLGLALVIIAVSELPASADAIREAIEREAKARFIKIPNWAIAKSALLRS